MFKFVKNHPCNINNLYAIEQYKDGHNYKWFINRNGKLDRIFYCPYCGEQLKEKADEP